jgi:predicted AlkP superfamily phosphohydrolase/phosphomutase
VPAVRGIILNRPIPEEETLLAALLVALLLLSAAPAASYVGPGAGFGLATSLLAVLNALLVSALSFALWPVLALARALRRARLAGPSARRVVVLGMDGLSPSVVRDLIGEGLLPAFAGLARSGTLTELATTTPGVSPVAWTSFMTGSNPGKHAIFDFLAPDRSRYAPRLSSVDTRESGGRCEIVSLRRGRPFWMELGRYGLRAVVLRVPVTYPPDRLDGFMLSGMCVPDLRGSQGTYTLLGDTDADVPGGRHRRFAEGSGGLLAGALEGPPGSPPVAVGLESSGGRHSLTLDGSRHDLEQGRLTPWLSVRFRIGRRGRARGIVRACLLQVSPPRLYLTAVHPDPWSPPVPISHPRAYSRYLCSAGRFGTIGLVEDTWALVNGAIPRQVFDQLAADTLDERRRMFEDAMGRLDRGLVVCVFDTPDRVQHVSWAQGTGPGSPVRAVYEEMDRLLSRTLSRLRRGDVLLVLSDHGFTSFDWCVDLNRFLLETGHLSLEEGFSPPLDNLVGVDWSRTKAYAMGLAGVNLNVRGREASGCVDPSDAPALMREIASALLELAAPDGARPVSRVSAAREIYRGPYSGDAPDLTVGLAPGFRVSWGGATGGIGESVIGRNSLAWSGDHSQDSESVPGILASTSVLSSPASITDVAPTVLTLLGIPVPPSMDGRALAARR